VGKEINVKGETRLKAVTANGNCEKDSERRNGASRTAKGFRGSENLDENDITTLISMLSDEIQRFIKNECSDVWSQDSKKKFCLTSINHFIFILCI